MFNQYIFSNLKIINFTGYMLNSNVQNHCFFDYFMIKYFKLYCMENLKGILMVRKSPYGCFPTLSSPAYAVQLAIIQGKFISQLLITLLLFHKPSYR